MKARKRILPDSIKEDKERRHKMFAAAQGQAKDTQLKMFDIAKTKDKHE